MSHPGSDPETPSFRPDPSREWTLTPAGRPGDTVVTASAAPLPGDYLPVIPGYQLLRVLGQGGAGIVYLARQVKADRVVALKMLRAGAEASIHDRLRFRTEAAAIARLNHPHVVQIYDVGDHAGCLYFSLEYCPNGSLAGRLANGPLAPREAATVAAQLAHGVAAAHAEGILHRDLKPGNVLLTADDVPKLTDFGLAKRHGPDSGPGGKGGVTVSGDVLGTPSYMAPEQAAGQVREIGPRTDVYALGATLYEMLVGVPPFRGDGPVATALLVLTADPVPPRSHRPDVPAELEAICLKCLAKKPDGRYPTADAVAGDLERWLRGEPTVARPLGPAGRALRYARRKRQFIAGVAAAVLIAVAAFVTARALAPETAGVEPDPDAPLREYQRRIDRGAPAVLIGPTGPPAWHRWALGRGTIGESVKHRGAWQVGADEVAVLELLPDPGRDSYRLSAEFNILAAESSPSKVQAGVYFGYQEVAAATGFRAVRFVRVGVEEFFDAAVRPDSWRDPVARTANRLVCWVPRPAPDDPKFIENDAVLGKRLDLDPARRDDWRRIVVDVSPGRVATYYAVGPDDLRPLYNSASADVGDGMRVRREFLDREWPPALARLPAWSPRLPVGLVVQHATVAVRNVVIEPLAP